MKTPKPLFHFVILILSTSFGISRAATKYTDKGDDCVKLVKKGKCQTDPIHMLDQCEKSCMDLVKSKGPANCDELIKKGNCKTDPIYMIQHCEKKCLEWAQSGGTDAAAAAEAATAAGDNTDEPINCDELVKQNKCQTAGKYMLANCSTECTKWMQAKEKHETFDIDEDDKSFYKLSAKTAAGETIKFGRFEDYITIITSLNKACQHHLSTKELSENYFGKIEQIRKLSPFAIEIIGFPYEHPEIDYDKEDCTVFDEVTKEPRSIHVMETIKINGPDTHPVFKYLKETAGMDTLDYDMASFFVLSAGGDKLEVHYGSTLPTFMAFLRTRLQDYEL